MVVRVMGCGVVALSRGLAVPFANARLVVLAGEGCDGALIGTLTRMGVASVRRVGCIDATRRICAAGEVDACLVVLPPAVPDENPSWTAEDEAPGRGHVPTLLLADAVTPFVRTCVRAHGYAAAVPLGLPPRMLYRCIGALLQTARGLHARSARARIAGRPSRPSAGRLRAAGGFPRELPGTRKPKLQ